MAKNQGLILLPVNYSLTLLILLSLISPSISSSGNVKVQATVLDSICSQALDPASCRSALESDPRTASADLPGVALISLELAQARVTAALTMLGLLSKGATDPVLRQQYDVCTTYYSEAPGTLTNAAQAIKSGSFDEARSYAIDAMDDAQSCDDVFEPMQNPSAPLRETDADVANLCIIVFIVAGALM